MSFSPLSDYQSVDYLPFRSNIMGDETMYPEEPWKQQIYELTDSNQSTLSASSTEYQPDYSSQFTELRPAIKGNDLFFGGPQDNPYRWQSKHPEEWDTFDVALWIQHFADSRQLMNVRAEEFSDVDGPMLIRFQIGQFTSRDSMNGIELYMGFQQYLVSSQCQAQAQYLQTPTVVQQHEIEGVENMTSIERYIDTVSFDKDDKFISLPPFESFTGKAPPSHQVEVPRVVLKTEPVDRRDDTPPPSPTSSETSEASSTHSRSGRKGRSRSKGKLWEFVLNLLLDKETNPEIIKWEDRKNGVFRIVRSDKVARLWGIRKSNPSMTYEKMSRAMRYYYRKNILERIDGRRLVYKFGHSSSGWQI